MYQIVTVKHLHRISFAGGSVEELLSLHKDLPMGCNVQAHRPLRFGLVAQHLALQQLRKSALHESLSVLKRPGNRPDGRGLDETIHHRC